MPRAQWWCIYLDLYLYAYPDTHTHTFTHPHTHVWFNNAINSLPGRQGGRFPCLRLLMPRAQWWCIYLDLYLYAYPDTHTHIHPPTHTHMYDLIMQLIDYRPDKEGSSRVCDCWCPVHNDGVAQVDGVEVEFPVGLAKCKTRECRVNPRCLRHDRDNPKRNGCNTAHTHRLRLSGQGPTFLSMFKPFRRPLVR